MEGKKETEEELEPEKMAEIARDSKVLTRSEPWGAQTTKLY